VTARIDAVVQLSLADDPSEAELVPISSAASGELLAGRTLPEPNKHLNIFGHEPAPGAVERTRDAVAELPAFRFRYNFRDVRGEADRLAGFLADRVRANR
jgi:hypothetical protein